MVGKIKENPTMEEKENRFWADVWSIESHLSRFYYGIEVLYTNYGKVKDCKKRWARHHREAAYNYGAYLALLNGVDMLEEEGFVEQLQKELLRGFEECRDHIRGFRLEMPTDN